MLTAMLTATISVLVGATLLTACAEDKGSATQSANTTTTTEDTTTTATQSATVTEETTQSEESSGPLFLFDNFTILPEDSLGNIYAETAIINNSDYALTFAELRFEYYDEQGNKQDSIFWFSDTLLPGEKSTRETASAPANTQDMIPVGYSIHFIGEDNKTHILDHDIKLNKTTIDFIPIE